MTILLIGASGRTGKPVATQLARAQMPFRVLVRNEQYRAHFSSLGGDVALADLRSDFSRVFDGIDTVIFTAGSAETEGAEAERLIDLDAIVKSVDYAKQHGAGLFVVVSTLLAAAPERGPEALRHYAEMKQASDDYVIRSGLHYAVLRPGPLTMEPAAGTIALTNDLAARTPVAREDVALVVMEVLKRRLQDRVIGFTGGDVPIAQALAAL